MNTLIKVVAALALLGLVAGAAGCNAPVPRASPPKSFEGVTFIGDKDHHAKVFHLSSDGRAAVGFVFDPDKATSSHGGLPDDITLDAAPTGVHSFHWTQAGGLKVIKTPDGRDVWVEAISGNGLVAVGRFEDEAGLAHVFRWTLAGGVEDLGHPDSGPAFMCSACGATATAVSADGSIIFGRLFSGGSFRWTRASGLRNLHIPGEVRGVSADGSMAMGSRYVEDRQAHVFVHLFVWTTTRGFEDLGTPSATAANDPHTMRPEAISGDGSTIVGEYPATGDQWRGFRWTRAGGFRDLPGGEGSEASAVSGDGSQIVGELMRHQHGLGAVRWRGDEAPQPIGQLALRAVSATISADGHTIAGAAAANRRGFDAFVLKAP